MRHPQERNCASGRVEHAVMTRVASSAPEGPPMLVTLAANPRLPLRECSSDISAAPPHSPPTAIPCTTRSSTSRMGAAAPIWAYVGSRPIRVEATPMMDMVTTSIDLRPTRIPPKWPKMMPPRGRAK